MFNYVVLMLLMLLHYVTASYLLYLVYNLRCLDTLSTNSSSLDCSLNRHIVVRQFVEFMFSSNVCLSNGHFMANGSFVK